MIKEFRAFIMRGNVLDLAVGVIIGAAFGAVVKSLVDDIIMPPIGAITGGIDFSAIVITVGGVAIRIGTFINTVIYFLIVSAAIFAMIRALARMQDFTSKKEAEEAQKELPPTTEVLILEELKAIHAALDKQNGTPPAA